MCLLPGSVMPAGECVAVSCIPQMDAVLAAGTRYLSRQAEGL
jgi:hypothetical protein